MQSGNFSSSPVVKRPRSPDTHHTSATAQPPAKRRRIEPSARIGESATTLTPSQQHTRDSILRQLADTPYHLDLSALPASALIMLPADALGTALAEVASLRLPPVLWQLPAFCRQMTALRELHLPHFSGDSLDVKDLPRLQRVEGSAGSRLGIVHADALTELDIEVMLRLRKVRVQRYADGQPSHAHALPGHAYTHIAPGAAAPDYTQLNGAARFRHNGEAIVCRHIARHLETTWASTKRAGRASAAGVAGIATSADLTTKLDCASDESYTLDMAFCKRYVFIDDAGFGSFAARELELLMRFAKVRKISKAWASYYIASTNHVTNLLLSAKTTTPPVFAATLADPNALLARRRIEAHSLPAILHVTRGWRLTQLIDPQMLRRYTDPGRPPLMYAFNSAHRPLQQRPTVQTYLSQTQLVNGEWFYLMMLLCLHEPLGDALRRLLHAYQSGAITGAKMYHALAARNLAGSNGLSAALLGGSVACVTHFTDAVEGLTATLTTGHLPQIGSDRLPDRYCDSLMSTTQSWSEIVFSQASGASAGLAALVGACQRLFERGHLSAEACVGFLQRGGAGERRAWNAFDAAVTTHDEPLLSAFGTLLASLYMSGAVNGEQCQDLVKDAQLLARWVAVPRLPGIVPMHDSGLFDDAGLPIEFDNLFSDFAPLAGNAESPSAQADSDFSINW